MTSNQVAFLYKAAYSLPSEEHNENIKFLKSYYLMRCQQITNGYGLPEKQFSSKTRCPKCCTEWSKGSVIKLKPIKLSKQQRRRIRKQKQSKDRDEKINILKCNQMEQICSFCKNITTTNVMKPESFKIINKEMTQDRAETKNTISLKVCEKKNCQPTKENLQRLKEVKPLDIKREKNKNCSDTNIYGTAKDVFSLKNKDNTLSTTVKEAPKIIKNNKRKKDKFAGLCQKAVLASIKMKEEKEKQNKLNLFLKPSR